MTNFDPHDESKMGQDAIECQKGPAASYIPIQFDITNLYRKWCMTDESGNSQNFASRSTRRAMSPARTTRSCTPPTPPLTASRYCTSIT